jgi:hypothetical protein
MTTSKRDDKLRGWLTGRLPADWFEADPEITRDKEETLIVGRISAPQLPGEASAEERGAAEAGRITEFRERTRDQRMQIARELEHASGRKVAWGAVCGDTRMLFTTLSVPVMTRLRQPERLILDTLVDSGVARSRSEALAWCVRLVGQHAEEWLAQLRTAMEGVEKVRTQGPG